MAYAPNSRRFDRFSDPIVRMNLWVRKDLYDEVIGYAKREHITISDVVRQAVEEFTKNQIRKDKETSDGRSEDE